LKAVSKENTAIVAPIVMADMLPSTIAGTFYVMKNGQKTNKPGFFMEAVPMYNLPEKADSYHVKGRGNGYVVELGGKRVYISGDTSNTPEMRNLKNIDIAFVSMNLPYTMSVESATSGVLAFKPKQVYPYHYRGTSGLSDINKFKELVNKGDQNINVILLDWYPKKIADLKID
jgi:L-ascorbate metabolism protein UlaG (beta-lactamase superfamily)